MSSLDRLTKWLRRGKSLPTENDQKTPFLEPDERDASNMDVDKEIPELSFLTQLAHGSDTARINGFSNVKELYNKISQAFKIDANDILFCTLNSPKVNMEKLLGGQIGLHDFIFAHLRGPKKTIQILKDEVALGLTITDNGNGLAFIKRIRTGSTVDREAKVCVGDHIEEINGKNLIGSRHYEVARMLKGLPVDEVFSIQLVEPIRAWEGIAPRSSVKPQQATDSNLGTGKGTLRLRSSGKATVEDIPSDMMQRCVNKIDDKLEAYLGIRDMELAQSILEYGKDKENPDQFATQMDQKLSYFYFPDEFIFEVWGLITDAKASRLF